MQHTHTRHQYRAVLDLPLVHVEIVAAQFVIVAVAGIHPGVADQQIFDALGFAALLEQPQCRDNFIVHFIVEGSVIFEVLDTLPAI